MHFGLRVLLALGLLFAVEQRAFAFVTIDVDLSSQTMRVHSSDGESYVWPISSGRDGHLTPRGVFRPRAMYAMVHSAKYDNAPMPHAIFFYGQYAIHGTDAVGALGSPASHGCIRLSPAERRDAVRHGAVAGRGRSASRARARPRRARRPSPRAALAYAPTAAPAHAQRMGAQPGRPLARAAESSRGRHRTAALSGHCGSARAARRRRA